MKSDKFQSYFMSLEEYNNLTDKLAKGTEDGDELQVINESVVPHRVVKYCISFNGFWCER